MSDRMKPLTIDLVQNGVCLEELNREIEKAAEKSIAFYVDNSKATPQDCKTKVVLELELMPSSDLDQHYEVHYRIKRQYPQPLKRSSLVMQDGLHLVTNATGSDYHNQAQKTMDFNREADDEPTG